jgi:competence transcription factor ComK
MNEAWKLGRRKSNKRLTLIDNKPSILLNKFSHTLLFHYYSIEKYNKWKYAKGVL